MLQIGLTGGIASGKSYVANLFATLGARLIDTDVIARDIVQVGSEALSLIVEQFGNNILHADRTLNRALLRQLIFADREARTQLEHITHPRIRAEVQRQVALVHDSYNMVVVPLMAEGGRYGFLQQVIVVDCDEQTQHQRLVARDGISSELADQMIATQARRSSRLALADHVIENGEPKPALLDIVQRLHQRFQAESKINAT
jgi:dephospho-CoA kinase